MNTPRSSLATTLSAVACVSVLAACGSAESTSAPAPTEMSTTTAQNDAASPASQFTGVLGGDAQLEGGCVWLETADERYELRVPDDYTIDVEALSLTTPEGTTIGTGDEITVTGNVAEGMVTACQIGPVLQVQQVN